MKQLKPMPNQARRADSILGVIGAVGVVVIELLIFTAVAAAIIGSLIAPAISAGVGRVFNMDFELPELPFRAVRYGKYIL